MQGTRGKQDEFAVMLRVNSLFGGLDAPIIETLAGLCSTRKLAPKAVLFQKGDPGDAMYGIRRGQVSVERGTDDGQRIVVASLGAGDVFGEVALLDGQGRSADIVATEATELFVLRRADLVAYIKREPSVALRLIEILCVRLRSVLVQVEQTLTRKLDVRLASRLVALAQDFGETLTITQEQLARHVGATRETVNRQLQTWQAAGILELKRGRILLKDESALRALDRSVE